MSKVKQGVDFATKVPQEIQQQLRRIVSQKYPGKTGGKTEYNFWLSVVRYVGFLAWRAKINQAERLPGPFQYVVPFARREEAVLPRTAGVKNPRKVRMFLLSVGILSVIPHRNGFEYAAFSGFPTCKRYRVNLENFPFFA